jgi:hypothetical protein
MPEYYAGVGGGNRFGLTFWRHDPSFATRRTRYEWSGALDASPDGIAILATILSAENVGCSKRIKATEHVFGFL